VKPHKGREKPGAQKNCREKKTRTGKGRLLRRLLAVFLVLAGIGGFLFYGPFEQFRLLWINTAMYSSHYKFLATSLYSPAYIASVLERNSGGTVGKTDPEPLQARGEDSIIFAEIKGNHYKGYLIKIGDPARLSLVRSSGPEGELVEQLVAKHGAAGGINAGGYADDKARGRPTGIVIVNGELVNRCAGRRHVIGGFRGDHKLVVGAFSDAELAAQDYDWAFEFGPLLVVNGEKTELNAFSGGLSPRTAIGQTADGSVLLLVIDGRQLSSIGATYLDVQTVLYANGAVNAIGLDGGSSSSMVLNGKLVNSPSDGDNERLLPNAIVF
jgi:exopolysaccharide biosynthesis protein